MLPFRRENRGVKRKNDYYYIIKLGIFQRKSEKFWVIDKKKKKFYDFCVRCHIKTEESANQSKGCGAKLQGL